MLKINRENLKTSHQLIWFIIDFLMLGLLIINLAFIIFSGVASMVEKADEIATHWICRC